MSGIQLKPTLTIERLAKSAAHKYLRMRELAEEERTINARAQKLKEERKQLSAEIEDAFGARDQMRLSARMIVLKKTTKVGIPAKEAYSYEYVQFKEVAG